MTLDDARPLAELMQANREFLAPWDPLRPEEAYTVAGQRESIAQFLRGHADGGALPHVILDGERIIGRVTLTNISRGAFQSCTLGYWVNEADNGRGHASAAVTAICERAFSQLRLHRIEAGTLVHNVRSQAVLAHNGFERFGLAPRYLNIAGRWQDHVLFQKLADDR